MEFKDIKIEGSDYEIGLTKLIGKKIKEVRGYLSAEIGEPTFKLTKIEFEDGTFLGVEGEHDMPYLVKWDEQPNFNDDELMEKLYREGNPDEVGEE